MVSVLSAAVIQASLLLPIRVEGEGYMRFCKNGHAVYAKRAELTIHSGRVSHQDGTPLLPSIWVDKAPQTLAVDSNGVLFGCEGQQRSRLGKLILAYFEEPKSLIKQGHFYISEEQPYLKTLGGTNKDSITSPKIESAKKTIVPNTITVSEASKPSQTSSSFSKVKIDVHTLSEVTKDVFTLGEIAKIEGDDSFAKTLSQVVIGDTPALGVKRGISKYQIDSRIKMAKLPQDKVEIYVPGQAIVMRQGQRLGHELFVQKAIDAAKAQFNEVPLEGQPGQSHQFTPDTPPSEMHVPLGQLELMVENVQVSNQKATVTIAPYVDGHRINSRTIILSKRIPPRVLQSGASVRVRIISNAVKVETNGQAKSASGLGEYVDVQTAPNVIVRGIVLAPNLVEVRT